MAAGNDETKIKSLLSDFVRETIPDYILDGSHAIVASDGIQKLTVNRHVLGRVHSGRGCVSLVFPDNPTDLVRYDDGKHSYYQ